MSGNLFSIPTPRAPLVDDTKHVTTAWYVWFNNMFRTLGSGQTGFTFNEVINIIGDNGDLSVLDSMSRGPSNHSTLESDVKTLTALMFGTRDQTPQNWIAGFVRSLGANLTLANGTLSAASGTVLQGYIGGLTLSNDVGTPNTVYDIAAGQATSDDATTLMTLASAYTKTTGAWAVGTGNGSLDTGAVANSTWYHVFVIERTDTSVVDLLISTSATAPTMPTNYTKKRRIGSFFTSGAAAIIGFVQHGNTFLWKTPINTLNATSPGATTAVSQTVSVPPGVIVEFIGSALVTNAATTTFVYYSDLATTDTAAAGGAFTFATGLVNEAPGGQIRIFTNTSQQIRMRNANAGDVNRLVSLGWVDLRGRFD